MTVYFADTSALAKRYISETGSAWVRSWTDQAAQHVVVISALTTVEFVSLLARRQREGHLSPADLNKLRKDFLFHVRHQYRVIRVQRDVLARAQQLIIQYPLRTLDAMQLASAVMFMQSSGLQPIFVCADQRLLNAALGQGLAVDDPNAHP
ncbi:MAG TPA: type II toxin-antitoxin system VapC family toxin [Aggregatilineaceae bacterium]|nr:type II toxin-antitoxin system VapC family toxin [Aggregatilineaceae bacterium]